jgi:hypothetical protein
VRGWFDGIQACNGFNIETAGNGAEKARVKQHERSFSNQSQSIFCLHPCFFRAVSGRFDVQPEDARALWEQAEGDEVQIPPRFARRDDI